MPTIKLSTTDNGVIEWKTTSWNPMTGCDRISAGCDNCYALMFAARLKEMGQARYQNDGDPRSSGPGFDLTLHPDTLNLPRLWRKPRHIFVGSMSDMFHPRVPLDYIQQIVAVMRVTPQHTYQVLTKRARRLANLSEQIEWPDNVWVGTSIEDASLLHRADDLRKVNAAVRFLSIEPLLGPLPDLNLDGIDWISLAGESGPGARPMPIEWVRDIRDQAIVGGRSRSGVPAGAVPFFFLQWGGVNRGSGRLLDGRTWDQMPVRREHRQPILSEK